MPSLGFQPRRGTAWPMLALTVATLGAIALCAHCGVLGGTMAHASGITFAIAALIEEPG